MTDRHPFASLPAPSATLDGRTIEQISDDRVAAELKRVRLLACFQPKHVQQALYAQALMLTRAIKHTEDKPR